MKGDSFRNHFLVCGLRLELSHSREILYFILKTFQQYNILCCTQHKDLQVSLGLLPSFPLMHFSGFLYWFFSHTIAVLQAFCVPAVLKLLASTANLYIWRISTESPFLWTPQADIFCTDTIKTRVGDFTNQV